MSETLKTAQEKMRENILDDKHNPHERLKDNSTEKKNSESVISSAKVCFFFSKLNFDLRNLY